MTSHRKQLRPRALAAVFMACALAATATASGAATKTTKKKAAATTKKATATTKGAVNVAAPNLTAPPTTAAQAGASGTTPRVGGRLTVLFQSEIAGLDPTIGSGSAVSGPAQRMFQIYDMLAYVDANTGSVVPSLLKSIRSTDEGKTWTLTLRDGVKFSDGTTLDAEAVKFNWDRHANPAVGSTMARVVNSQTTTVTGPLTLQVVLNDPNMLYPNRIAEGSLSYIGSPTAIKARGADFNLRPVGAGPFVVDRWVRDSELVLKRSPTYWNAPRPYLDELVLKVVVDDQQRLNSFKANEGAMAFVFDPLVSKRFKEAAASVTTTSQFVGGIMLLNRKVPALADVRVRKALALAFDQRAFARIIAGDPDAAPKGLFRDDSPYYDPAVNLPVPDLDAATALLKAYYADSGKSSLTLSYQGGSTDALNLQSEVIQAQLQRLPGVTINIDRLATPELVKRLTAGTFDGSTMAVGGAGPEPTFNTLMLSTGTLNFGGWTNELVDAALKTARQSTDLAVQRKAYINIAQQVFMDVPFILIQRSTVMFAKAKGVHGVQLFADGAFLGDRVWVDQ